jgi:prepilin-type N-terminal cleavage/methylation domain-containing protein
MARPTPVTSRPTARRGGFTLPECLIATSMVAISVAALGGALDVVYSNQRFVQNEAAAMKASQRLLEEAVALPVVPESSSDVALASLNDTVDVISLGAPSLSIATTVVTAAGSSASAGTVSNDAEDDEAAPVVNTTNATRRITVSTGAVTVGGRSINNAGLKVVEVATTLPDGRVVRIKRVATSAEQRR